MAGKTTILDRLVLQGKIKPKLGSQEILSGLNRDPLSLGKGYGAISARDEFRRAGMKKFADMTPERRIYQRGIEARLYPKKVAADSELDEANREVEELEDEWNTGVENAKEGMMEDWRSTLDYEDFSDIDPDYLEVETPSTDLRDFWSDRNPEEIYADYGQAQERAETAQDRYDYIYSPRAVMDEQVQTPRYRNYQRAMQQREANKRMGHQLSRMWGDAYNRLRARGLSDAEARMFIRERFGGR